MAKTCGFCDCIKDKLIVDRLLFGFQDEKIWECLISSHNLTLNAAVDICRTMESASLQIKAMKSEETHKVKLQKTKVHYGEKYKPSTLHQGTSSAQNKRCLFC